MTSDEPAIAVNAPATSPPVQDSAIATCQPRARQASRTDWARVRISASNTDYSAESQQDRQHQKSVDRSQEIVEHDAETTVYVTIRPAHRPRLPDIEDAKQQKGKGIGQGIEGRRQQHHPLRRDFVDHDRAGILDGAHSGNSRSSPPADDEDDRSGNREPRHTP